MIFAQSNMKKFLYTPGMFFEIPEFQRPYSWQTNNVREFLNDLEECIEKQKKHYFGTVVQVEDTSSTYSNAIIDGQQRVTTSLLMIASIYHLVKKDSSLIDNPETTAEKIEYQYLINKDLDNNRVKLRTVTTDNQILQRIFDVNGDESRLTLKERQSNLFQVYSEFCKYFSGKKGLDKYIDGLGHFEISALTLVSGDDNPQRVFESINSTGKPLTDGDKIRNFALMLNNNATRDHVYKFYWTLIEEALVDVSKDYITDFFRSYIISKKQAIVKLDAVYPEFKKLFERQIGEEQNLEKINDFYSDIIQSLRFYQLLKFGVDSSTDGRYHGITSTIFKMRYIQTDLYIPFAISVMRYRASGSITKEQLDEVFKLIETYFSRRIVCNINTTSVDRFFASLHKDAIGYLEDTPEANYVDILKYLLLSRTGQTRMPSDAEYENAICTNPTYTQRNSLINYILTSIDGKSKESNTLNHIASGDLKLSIEHVMPQTLTKEWEQELGADEHGIEHTHLVHDQYMHTLANLTLTGYNSEYSNRSFNDKKTLIVKGEKVGFNDSDLRINKWIAKHDSWNEKTLKERQIWWIENLHKVWPLPDTTFKPVKPDMTVSLLKEDNLKGKGIRSVQVFGDVTLVGTWSEALDIIAETLYDKYPKFYEVVSLDEFLSKYFKTDNSGFYNSVEILETGYYIDTGNDTNTKLRIIHALCKLFDIASDDVKAELVAEKNTTEEE
jgi:uncharacterized protein with ParB-like and HNH nuclease domain